ncbi:hypothetical protein [Clostridium lundense]|uniref:hypothetical protein n=1 Tax=Clostridium lundense TaxID=319475 RepID=UPI000555BFDB|nr:hypothetical protein [Clostridium lundense]
MKKKGVISVIIIFLFVIAIGFIKVSSSLPNFIKNKSKFKIFYTSKPFDLTFETDKYVIYINKKAIYNINDRMSSTFNNIVQGTSKASRNIIDGAYEKINHTVEKFKKSKE